MESNQRTKNERFAEFLKRLQDSPPAKSFAEAYSQIFNILNEVEDEMTTIPYDPDNWQTDGRLYPPLMDSMRSVPGYPLVKRFRSRQHNTFICENGSIEIREIGAEKIIFNKSGENGKGVW